MFAALPTASASGEGRVHASPNPTDPHRLVWRWPGQCACCRQWTGWQQAEQRLPSLCTDCDTRFSSGRAPAEQTGRCRMCAQKIPLPARVCDCIRLNKEGPPAWDAAYAAVDYAHPWIELITDFKYRSRVERADLLARLARQALPAEAGFDRVSPIPLSEARLRERGYNQAWELARRVAKWLPEQPRARADLLLRADTPTPQARLGRDERLHNLDGTLMINPRRLHEVRGSRVLLVDDVMTTGATFQIASRALKRAGALSVVVLAVARTA